jgi:CheY-like chemotaxis protein
VNLMNNAAKYMEQSGQIWLGVKVLPAPSAEPSRSDRSPAALAQRAGENASDKEAVIRIRDNGIGISADLLPRIFDVFIQADGAAGHGKGGLGIGLTLARHLVGLHGGSIRAESEGLGRGSEFTVRLPLSEIRTDARSDGLRVPVAMLKVPAFKRILIVDDLRSQAKSMAMLLDLMGFESRVAYDGAGALTALEEFFPDVALIDIGLPGMSGYEVARRIRALPQFKDIMLIAQTGWGRHSDREQSREAGFDHHLTKPIDHQLLEKILRRSVETGGN